MLLKTLLVLEFSSFYFLNSTSIETTHQNNHPVYVLSVLYWRMYIWIPPTTRVVYRRQQTVFPLGYLLRAVQQSFLVLTRVTALLFLLLSLLLLFVYIDFVGYARMAAAQTNGHCRRTRYGSLGLRRNIVVVYHIP